MLDNTTLEEFFATVYLPQHDLAKLSVYRFRAAIRCLERWHGATVTLDMLTDDFVAGWLTALLDTQTTRSSVKGYRSNVLSLWRFAYVTGAVEKPPRFVKPIKLPKRIPDAWTLEQLTTILNMAAKVPTRIGSHRAGDWWLALLLIMYDTGCRITSVMYLRTADVDLKRKVATFRAETNKTREDQWFSLSDQTVAALQKIWSHGRELVFGDWPYDWTQHDWKALSKAYRHILRQAHLPIGARCLFHKLRRTTATQVAKVLGKEAAGECMGHADADTTEEFYIDSSQILRRTPADVLPRPKLADEPEQGGGKEVA